MRHLAFAALLFAAACATTPTPSPKDEPKSTQLAAGDDEAPSVAVDSVEVHVTIDAEGNETQTRREVYRLLSADPGQAWDTAWVFWRPWTDEAPALEATVVAPDGTTVRLDPKTVSDQSDEVSPGLISDTKLRLAPLPNLSVGAVVERRWVRKRKPLFTKGTLLNLSLEPNVPEKKRVVVVEVPQGSPLHVEVLGATMKETREERDGKVVLRFERGPVTPDRGFESSAPPEAHLDAVLRVSTVESWQAAAQAYGARVQPLLDGGPVKDLVARVTKDAKTRDDTVRAVLAWLRGNVRYTGLELDDAAFIPRRPAEVLERKYGDCKDLAVLVAAMLRQAGLEADVALVSAGFHRDTTPGSPGLSGFNHAIVRVGSGPALWVDATAPWSALGEVPGSVASRLALPVRPDTTGLTRVTVSGVSSLSTTIEWTLPDDGKAAFKRTRVSDGLLFSGGREVAARSRDEYRKNLEAWAKKAHKAEKMPKLEVSEPAAPGAFREVLDLPESAYGDTEGDAASAAVLFDLVFEPVEFLFDLKDSLDKRTEPVFLPLGAKTKVVNVYHPPVGYRMNELPEPVEETVGPLKVSLTWRRLTGDDVEATLTADLEGPAVFTVDEVRRFVEEVAPAVDISARFPNLVLSAIDRQQYHEAVTEAAKLLKAHPTALRRSSLAYALSAIGLQEDAEQEARRAAAEAPKDLQVHNRLTFVLTHNAAGQEFGRGYPRAAGLKAVEESIAIDPEDEWALRLRCLFLVNGDDGRFVGTTAELRRAEAALTVYREKTKATALDDLYIDVLLRLTDWNRLAAELPKLPRSNQRDAALLAAEVVLKGAEAAWRRAELDGRLTAEAVQGAVQYVMLAREYPRLTELFTVAMKRRREDAGASEVVQGFSKLKRQAAPPKDSQLYPFYMLINDGLRSTTAAERAEYIDDELTDDEQKALAGALLGAAGKVPRGGADLVGFTQDTLLSLSRLDSKPVPGFGELVTLRYELRGVAPPASLVLVKKPGGYKLRFHASEELAAKAIGLLAQGKDDEARALFRMVVLLSPSVPRNLRNEEGDFLVDAALWSARAAMNTKSAKAAVEQWLEAQVGRAQLTENQRTLAASLLADAWKDKPDKVLRLAGQTRAVGGTLAERLGLAMQVGALARQGRHKEAAAVVDAELKQSPRNQALRSMRADLAAQLGDFKRARADNAALAADLPPSEAPQFLNNAAWWSLYSGEVDDTAVRDAELAIREGRPSAAVLHTAVCVLGYGGRWDAAARAMLQMRAASSREELEKPGSASLFARGLIAEGFGRLDTARAAYKKVTKDTPSTAADIWHLAQKRLQGLPKK